MDIKNDSYTSCQSSNPLLHPSQQQIYNCVKWNKALAGMTKISSILSNRYAQALLDLAEKSKAAEKVAKDLMSLEASLENSSEFQTFVASPLIKEEQQMAVMADIAKKGKFQKLTTNFLGVVVNNGRLAALPAIMQAYHEEMSRRSGEVVAEVTTADDLSAAQQKSLQKKLSEEVGQDVKLALKVDKSILGGVIVKLGSKMVDDSIARKLERLEHRMSSAANEKILAANENEKAKKAS